MRIHKNFINIQLFGIDYITCDECGVNFPDCGEFYCCENCYRSFCGECKEEAGLEFDTDEDGEPTRDVISCKYCRNEDFDDETLLEFALKKLNTTKEQLKEEIKVNE